ncbi:type II toxin-antitoxin system Phd/YefM family antitoxin [Tenggerimyces flavus]|uniref:Antitoxin n=1 Tax=Tenggerimyces flavus TaxID=1708749 RepID=A0ABV7YAQ0_9ACTN|nr:type II toxin-antitoxin system Phd/YefM family antitoxin [Tenggerimyces flavus]MBM7783648.1 prevent-host-death family protein [Tenggerimyces flavus]
MKTLPLSEAKAHLSEIADEVIRTHERVTVTRNGREAFVILSVEDLESIEATLELLADPDAQARVAQAEAEIAAGETFGIDEVEAAFRQRRSRDSG